MRKIVISICVAISLIAGILPGTAVASPTPADTSLTTAASAAESLQLSTQAVAKGYKGVYSYTYGDPNKWGTGASGYTIDLEIMKVSGNKVKLRMAQANFYGTLGFYRADSKAKTVTLKKGYAKFAFKTFAGDKGVARIKLVNKKKIKLSLKTTRAGYERIPLSTGGKYKTLKRANHGFYG